MHTARLRRVVPWLPPIAILLLLNIPTLVRVVRALVHLLSVAVGFVWPFISIRSVLNLGAAVWLTVLILRHVSPKPMSTRRPGSGAEIFDKKLLRIALLREANWAYAEMQDFVRLIQRYRGLYITAVFVSIGWLLGQALTANKDASGASTTLAVWRMRQDVAAILCLIPLLNALFVVLMFEAQFQMQSLARYRFILGSKLGGLAKLGGLTPIWRWEKWKETSEGSVRPWTNTSNILFGFVALTFPIAALWFCLPAVVSSGGILLDFWIFSGSLFGAVVCAAIYLGLKYKDRNNVARRVSTSWDSLS